MLLNRCYCNLVDEQFLKINDFLKKHYEGSAEAWLNSPFSWIKTQSSRRIGAIGELFVQDWLVAQGFNVQRSGNPDADRIVNGLRLEIKFSTLWETGHYTFQQIRDQNYEAVFCLGISPFDVHAWVIPKAVLWSNSTPQHGGQRGSDTHWIQVNPKDPFEWMAPYGGSLEQATDAFEDLMRRKS